MAIIDKNLVFMDGPALADGVFAAVPLNGFSLPGRAQAIPLRISVTEGYDPTEVQNLTLTLQQADRSDSPETGTGAWADVPGASLTVGGADLGAGCRLPWRFLPEGVEKGWVRMRCALVPVSGRTPTRGSLFAALLREEDFPYVRALQVK